MNHALIGHFSDKFISGVEYSPVIDKVLTMLHANPKLPWQKILRMFSEDKDSSLRLIAIVDHRIHYGLSFRHPWDAYLKYSDGKVTGFKRGRCSCLAEELR